MSYPVTPALSFYSTLAQDARLHEEQQSARARTTARDSHHHGDGSGGIGGLGGLSGGGGGGGGGGNYPKGKKISAASSGKPISLLLSHFRLIFFHPQPVVTHILRKKEYVVVIIYIDVE